MSPTVFTNTVIPVHGDWKKTEQFTENLRVRHRENNGK